MRYVQGLFGLCTVAMLAACGSDGSNGIDGENGQSCAMESIEDGEGYRVICGEDSVGVITNGTKGDNGQSCTMKPSDNGYKVICGEDSVGVITNGIKGDKGDGCSVSALPKGYRVTCGTDTVDVINDEIKGTANITLRVIDQNTSLPIPGALVLSAGANDSLYTDSLGVLTVEDNVLGEYTYIVAKKGYSAQIARVTLEENGTGDISRVPDHFDDVKMRKLGVSVNGTVLVKDGLTGLVSGAPKVKVILQLSDGNLYPSEITTETNESGVYTFSDLPESVGYTVYVPQTVINGASYASPSRQTISNLRVGERKDLPVINLDVIGLTPELVNHNLEGIDVNDTVVFSFSTELIADSVVKAWTVVKGGIDNYGYCDSKGIPVLTNTSISKDGTVLRIAPTLGSWTKYDQYCISGTGYTYEGQKVTVAKTFIPGNVYDALSSISGLTAKKYYDSYIQLDWKASGDDITGYKVYYKTNKVNDFREYSGWPTYSQIVPTDSSVCSRQSSQYNCEEYIDLGTYSSRYETNYYWYTKYDEKSSTNSYDRNYNGFDDSTSTLNRWFNKDSVRTAYSSESDFSNTVYLWKQLDTLTCDVSSEDYESSNYGYDACLEYDDYGSPDKSVRIGDDDIYYTYYWYVSKSPVQYDSCEVKGNESYSTKCETLKDKYGRYNDYTYAYYRIVNKDTAECHTTTASYAYEDEPCAAYTVFKRSPDQRISVYWRKTPIDSVYCTVKSTESIDEVYKCDSLQQANGSSYESSDRNFIWYTQEANVKPTAFDTTAFISASTVFANENITEASFIVLPYTIRNGEVFTSEVAKAKSVSIKK